MVLDADGEKSVFFFFLCVFRAFSQSLDHWAGIIYYFPKPGAKAKGSLQLAYDDSAHAVKNSDRSDFMFAINTAKRTFLMYPDSEEERRTWLDAISTAIESVARK
jgi:hypothetical protein